MVHLYNKQAQTSTYEHSWKGPPWSLQSIFNNGRQPRNKVLLHNLQQQRLEVTEKLPPQKAELAKFSLSRQIKNINNKINLKF